MAPFRPTHRVMVQQLTTTLDEGGGQDRVWNDFRAVWAQVKFNAVSSSPENGGVGQRRKAVVSVRYAPDLPDPARLIINSKIFRFLGSTRLRIGAGEFLEIECEESF